MLRQLPVRTILFALITLGAAACAREATAPPDRLARPHLAVTPTASTGYLVVFRSEAVPSDLAARVQALGGTVTYSHAGAGLAVVTGLDAAAAAQLGAGQDVASVEPDVEFALDDWAAAPEPAALDVSTSVQTPAGAVLFARQWDMRDILAPAAWSAGKLGDAGVTVAILDTGLDYDDLDLNGQVDLSRSTSFIPSDNAITATYFPGRNPVDDYHGHGTNVASTVSSKAFAFAGVSSRTTLIGVKVLGANGSSRGSSVFEGILWAADHGADVANMSLGGGFAKIASGQRVASINRVMSYANRKGMLVVVAAGNSSTNLDHNGNDYVSYCDAPFVVCVSATGPYHAADEGTPLQDVPAFYTNFGRSAITVAAPGGNGTLDATGHFLDGLFVWSMCAKHTLAGFTSAGAPILAGCQSGRFITGFIGTSQATPHVTGLAALLVAELGHGQPALIKQRLKASADDLGQPGTDPFYGAGRINVARALGL